MKTISSGTDRELIESVIETLLQGEALLADIDDATYTRKVPIAFNSSICGHYRPLFGSFSQPSRLSHGR